MTQKARLNRLSRGREQTVIMFNGLPPREPGNLNESTIPYSPQRLDETRQAWDARIAALGRELYPQARFVYYPHMNGDISSMEAWLTTRNPPCLERGHKGATGSGGESRSRYPTP